MEQKRVLLGLAACLLVSVGSLHAQSAPPRLAPTAFAVQIGESPSPLSVPTLIKASLELSGADSTTLAADTSRLEQIISEARQAVAPYHNEYEKGNALLVFMHEKLLTRYVETQARLDTLLRTGLFNCVSSAVLYMMLGRAIGLQVEGVYTPDHAFCTVKARGRLIDVETTNRYGFDPGTKTKFRSAFGNTGFAYVPPGDYRLRTPTNGRGLLSFILQDRMSLLERQARYGEAVGLAADRYAILRSKSAFHDLANEAGNYCALLNQNHDYTSALSFLGAFQSRYGLPSQLAKVMSGLLHNEVLRLSNAGHYGEALKLISDRASAGGLAPEEVASLKEMVSQRKLSEAVQTLPFDQALADVQQSYGQGDIPQSLYQKFLNVIFVHEAQRTASSDGYLAAVKVLERGIQLTGGDPQLERGRQIYLKNYVATVHNKFASLFNSRDYPRAEAVIKEGLKQVPDSSVLNEDLQLLRRTTAN